MDVDVALQMVKLERRSQDEKWGVQNHDWPEWIVILGEEFGEVCRAAYEGKRSDYILEMTQVAAVAVAALESCYRETER